MLQQIQFHIHEDEQRQQEIEQSLALQIRENYRLSIGAFERYIPSLYELVKKADSADSTLFCNKYAELNIVNYNTGQVLYGMHPRQEVEEHFNYYLSNSAPVELNHKASTDQSVLVCLGLGLAYQIEQVIEQGSFKHVVVYEPNIDYFVCSLSSVNWKSVLQKAHKKGIALYLQIGSDGSNFIKDMAELSSYAGINKVHYYKHLNFDIFNGLESELASGSWAAVENWRPKLRAKNDGYLPLWAPLKEQKDFDVALLDENRKKRNLAALKKYFPGIYEEFSKYEPKDWCPVANESGTVNLVHISTQALFSVSPKDEADISFDAFTKRPNKDGLLLSYKGKKLKRYLHYQLVENCEKIMGNISELSSELPEKIKSLIMFGIGSGYSIEALMHGRDIDMLFICETNRDFFYASLYAIDWLDILSVFDEGKKRLYLNIGDDGSNLTNDLLVQFQSVGPYVLANTFFYQTYVNDKLSDAVARLREQLLVIIAMGDYFDNARYGIAHTNWSLEKDIAFLLAGTKQILPDEVLNVPVFVVGNGPSLDGLIEILKTEGDKAIIISCGTALQALHSNGIRPDFHAEIETNRSTFDWLSRIDDLAYLKDITLLSCNGIHPDSAAFFCKTLLAFKQGEASTVSLTELTGDFPFALLESAYPTVTNFVADIVTSIGFNQIYLFGVDMGFVSDSYHHSKSSGYYEKDGQQLYNYSENHSMSLSVPGNFKPWVKTKYEFKVSKGVLELVFSKTTADVYNLNDGAKIAGARALRKELVLVSNSEKEAALSVITEKAFSNDMNSELLVKFNQKYNSRSLIEELEALVKLLKEPLDSVEDVEHLIATQRELIVKSLLRKKSLLFYYLNGTMNYINSVFSKLLNITDKNELVDLSNKVLKAWHEWIVDIKKVFVNDQFGYDNISPFPGIRRTLHLKRTWNQPLRIVHQGSQVAIKSELSKLVTNGATDSSAQVVINWVDEQNRKIENANTCNVVREFDRQYLKHPAKGMTLVSQGDYKCSSFPYQSNAFSLMNSAILALMIGFKDAIFIPRFSEHPLMSSAHYEQLIDWSKSFYCYSAPEFIMLSNEIIKDEKLLLVTGDRLSYIPSLKLLDLRIDVISQEVYQSRVDLIDGILFSQKVTKH